MNNLYYINNIVQNKVIFTEIFIITYSIACMLQSEDWLEADLLEWKGCVHLVLVG